MPDKIRHSKIMVTIVIFIIIINFSLIKNMLIIIKDFYFSILF